MLRHLLTNFEIQKYYQNEPKFNAVYSRNNLSKIKRMEYIIHLDEYQSIGSHGIALYANDNNVIYFDSFGVTHIPKEGKKFIGNKNVKQILQNTTYRLQAYDSIMCGHFCIGFIDFMLKGKSLLEYTNSFSLNYEKNDKIILKYL